MPRKYRHIKDDEKELIDIKQGTVPCFTLFCLKFNFLLQVGSFCTVCTIRGSSPNAVCFFTIMLW